MQVFNINSEYLQIDVAKTKEFYLTQNKILEGCSCNDCYFYTTTLIKSNLEIFRILNDMGIDLSKNLSSEPTGAWCIRDEKEGFLSSQQTYQAVGQFLNNNNLKVVYEKVESNLNVFACFLKTDSDKINVDLIISRN